MCKVGESWNGSVRHADRNIINGLEVKSSW